MIVRLLVRLAAAIWSAAAATWAGTSPGMIGTSPVSASGIRAGQVQMTPLPKSLMPVSAWIPW